jgi:hypothetical protein
VQPHRGSTILVLGILGLVLCTIIAPFAWSMGNVDLRNMEAGVMDSQGRQLTEVGRILGIVGCGLLGLQACVFLVMGLVSVLG